MTQTQVSGKGEISKIIKSRFYKNNNIKLFR